MLKGRIFFWCLLFFCLVPCLVGLALTTTIFKNNILWKNICVFLVIVVTYFFMMIINYERNIYTFDEEDKKIIADKIIEFVKNTRCISIETTKKIELLEIFSQKLSHKNYPKKRFCNTKDINFILKNTFVLTADSIIMLEITKEDSVGFLKDKIVIKPIDRTKSTFDKITIRKINN